MSFYVTLPSHSADLVSDYGKKINSQSDFNVYLKKSISLPINKYEVSLVEMTFKNSWRFLLGRFILKDDKDLIIFDENIYIYDGLSLKETCRFLTEKFNDIETEELESNKKIIQKRLQNEEPPSEINEFFIRNSKDINKRRLKELVFNFDLDKVNFFFVESKNISIYIPGRYKLKIEGFFSQLIYQRVDNGSHNGLLFGNESYWKGQLDYNWTDDEEPLSQRLKRPHKLISQVDPMAIELYGGYWMTAKAFLNYEYIKRIESLYVYTNIIEDTYVGDDKKKLLRIVAVNTGFDNYNVVIFNNPHYIPLENDFIDHIRMIVKDAEGNNIQFTETYTPVIYKLHFRKKEY